MPETTSIPSLVQPPQKRANHKRNFYSSSSQQASAIDVERVCRILIRFAQLTEEIDHATTAPLRTTQE